MSLPGSAFVTPFILWQGEKGLVLTYVSPGFPSVTPFILWQCEKWGWFDYMSLPGFPSVMQFLLDRKIKGAKSFLNLSK